MSFNNNSSFTQITILSHNNMKLILIGKSWKIHPEIFLEFSFSGLSHRSFYWKTNPLKIMRTYSVFSILQNLSIRIFWYMVCKLGCVFPMVISSDFRMGEHRDDDHEEDAPYFTTPTIGWRIHLFIRNLVLFWTLKIVLLIFILRKTIELIDFGHWNSNENLPL